jgi:integrase
MQEYRVELRRNRRTPMTPCQRARKPKSHPLKAPGERYDVAAYRRAIKYGCNRASVPAWHAHQLRHGTATKLRREFGLDTARAVLGHSSPVVTEVYAEMDQAKAAEAMERVG